MSKSLHAIHKEYIYHHSFKETILFICAKGCQQLVKIFQKPKCYTSRPQVACKLITAGVGNYDLLFG
jgi:hypothetical protein